MIRMMPVPVRLDLTLWNGNDKASKTAVIDLRGEIQMKKIFLAIIMICLMGSLTACGDKKPTMKTEENTKEISSIETEVDNTSEKESEEKTETEETKETETTEEKEPQEKQELPEVLSLIETRNARYEGINDYERMLLISKFNNVTFWEGADTYPEMNRTFTERATMQKNAMEDEADNLLVTANEVFEMNPDTFETYISTMDVQVRRADSVVTSYLTDSYSDYGFIDDFRGMWGSNYDTQSGQELKLADVIKDMEQIPALVLKELNSHLWAGDDYPEAVIADYFKNTPEDGISWTLDYNGVTFYFGDGDISEPGNGGQTATVSFAEHPELFVEKYLNVPEAYMVRLPLDASFFTDLDEDGTPEELNCTGTYDRSGRFYSAFGLYTDTDGYYHYEDVFAYGFNPYYVKTAEGNHYLYLFCEESEVSNRQMMLLVYNVNGGQFTKVGEMNAAPMYIPSDMFVLPLNPNHMLLDNFDSLAQDAEAYRVGKNGMPVLNGEEQPMDAECVEVDNVEAFLEAIKPGATIMFKPGYYNLSDYIEKIWSEQGEEWNQKHPYVELYECWDGGIEVAIQDVKDLSIFADLEGAVVTELVVETRAGAVLNFEDCNNIFLHGLTMGHTQDGACDSSVISFRNTTNVYLTAMDLYGCGMYGFDTMYGSGNIYVQSCTIRDCEYGPFYIMDAKGKYEFRNCWLSGSNGGGYYESADGAELSFVECNFGEKESNRWYFDENANFTDCYWEEITEYPDVEPEGEDYET